ncbi:LysR family transcriptional regulator [Kaistia algarum]|uniref:LysR family transcriptional regulator n=1 Tax=Kaistia algarum TaxID=2083279 RepID=UPI000CE7DCA3|nr:LysR family transcriptional regulator [Kaistia algarum]MCX5512940.1 LysR family transcriptional regulator [Kaistia algarum]PPE81572.1 LysR family transcriptional regulator [Kaistia algarum]
MDNRAGEMAVFVATAESGGFSAAGRKLGLSPSAVSKLVARMEDRLGTPLLVRSTRTLQLTAEGALYLERARRILADIDEADRMVAAGAGILPRGRLRISASVAFGEHCLLPLMPTFLRLHPHVELDISLTDAVIDLVDERTDIAIRTGPLRDSTLMARKLLETRRVIVASPPYLEARGIPRIPHDLAGHNCLRFNFRRSLDEWPFRDPSSGETYTLPITGNAFGNNGVILRQLALGGLGLTRLGAFHVAADIAAGRLVPVLETFNTDDIERIHAVYVGHEHLAARIRTFVDFLAETIKKSDRP